MDIADDSTPPAASGPLTGLLVIDLSRALAGPHAGMILGDLGARIIKVESPGRGDDSRSWGPPFIQPDGASQESTYFLSCNRNKESIALDLRTQEDSQVLTELLTRADVLIENFRAGALTRLGFSEQRLAQLNPRLVTLSISGFGHDGPEGGRAGYDQIAQGEAGLMSLTGSAPDDPQRVGVPIADLLAGLYGVIGTLAALVERADTRRGQLVRTSLLASIVGVHAFQGTKFTVAGETGQAQGNHHPSIAPYGLFRCRDGAVQIAVGNEGLWRAFCTEFGIDPKTPDLASNSQRVTHHQKTIAAVEDAFAGLDSAALLARLAAAGVPAGRVRTLREVYEWDQTASQHLLIDVDHESLGPITLPGSPLRFFDYSGDIELETTRRTHVAPPVLDSDRDRILRWLDAAPS